MHLGSELSSSLDSGNRWSIVSECLVYVVCVCAISSPLDLIRAGFSLFQKVFSSTNVFSKHLVEENAVDYGVGFASNTEVDEINISNATFLATAASKDSKGYMTADQEAFHR